MAYVASSAIPSVLVREHMQDLPVYRFKGPRQNATSDLVISVPPGTLVKKKRSGQLLGELLVPGDLGAPCKAPEGIQNAQLG